ncbi:MAG: lipid A biosynthesis lauroyl acyltransferase [Pirellulaceae bacterium]|nr:MAG: lipid A biosynthesis lauroyl acyltransferase [Pirellulaceae bacterium]
MRGERNLRRRIADRASYLLLRIFLCVLQTTDLQTLDRWCHVLAALLANWIPVRRKVIDDNLRRVLGDAPPQELAVWRQRSWHHLLLMLAEIAHAPRKIRRTNWLSHFRLRNREQMIRAILEDRPALLATGHFGNFEMAGYAMGVFGIPAATVARPLDNPVVDAYLNDFRRSGGQQIFAKDGSAPRIERHLAQRGNLAILADQHAGPKGVWVDFFGHPTSCHKAIALFVFASRAIMSVTYTRRLDRPMLFELGCIEVCDPVDLEREPVPAHLQSVESLTEWYNRCLEQVIRLAPEQYWWVHRRWRDVPPNVQRRMERKRLAAQQASRTGTHRAEKAA